MLELKLICYCGQKYKFDVEPVNGLMPFTVKCPICNLDGTARANEMLAHLFAVPPKPAAPAPAPAPAMATTPLAPPPPPTAVPRPQPAAPPPPPPVAAVAPSRTAAPPPPPVAPPPPVPAMQRPPAPTAVAAPPPPAKSAAIPPPATVQAQKVVEQKLAPKKPGKFNLGLGIAGAVAGALAGCGLMYGILHYTHFSYLPIGVVAGLAAGYMAQWLARGCASTLGIITAVIAGGAVAGTLWFMNNEFAPLDSVSIVFSAGVAYLAASGLMAAKAPRVNG